MSAIDLVIGQPWMIRPEAMPGLVNFAERITLTPEDIKALHGDADPYAVRARAGRPMEETRTVEIRDGVAIVPVRGVISRYANLFTEASGGTSTQILATDFQAALDSSRVRAILLEIDSPGGMAAGNSEFANRIYAARNIKPVVAYVSNLGCSAAYYFASAASQVVVASSGIVGSIGTVMAVEKPAPEGKQRTIEIVSSQSPNKRVDPTTTDGRNQLQNEVDALAQVFVEDVAKFRDITPESVMSDFGAGGVKVGQAAVDAGMCDRLGSFEEVLASLASGAFPAAPARSQARGVTTVGIKWTMFKPREDGSLAVRQADDNESAELDAAPEPKQATAAAATAQQFDIENHPQFQALAKELEKERAARAEREAQALAAAASAFADAEVKACRLMPIGRDALAKLYSNAAMLDQHNPGMGNVDSLKAFCAAVPPHNLTTETIVTDEDGKGRTLPRTVNGSKVLASTGGTVDPHAKPSPDRVKELLAMTPEGAALLAERNGSH